MGAAAFFSGEFQQGGTMDLGLMIGTILVLAILGVGLYMLFKYVPMEPMLQMCIKIFVALCLVYWLLGLVGIVPRFH